MDSILDAVRPTVDRTIAGLSRTKFKIDPIAGTEYSRVTSIVSSAYKRHGDIVERALYQALKAHNAIEAHHKVPFFVSRTASSYVESHNFKSEAGRRACLAASLPYQTDVDGSDYEIDILYYDHRSETIVALEVKRGHGQFDRGKRDSLIKAALMTRVLLESYAESRGWTPSRVESRILAYYGVPKFPDEIYLRGRDLDTFVAPLTFERVEEVNQYFSEQLHNVLERGCGQGELIQ